jgi:hypothetical protein
MLSLHARRQSVGSRRPEQLRSPADTLLAMSLRMRNWVLVAIAATATAVCFSGSAHARERTTVTLFQAFAPGGHIKMHTRSKDGYCWEGALATRRRDAWRCSVPGRHISYLYDPCFSSARHPGIVVCPEAFSLATGVEIRLTKPLPQGGFANHSAPSLRLQPWLIEVYDGRRAQLITGASSVAEGVRLNYGFRVGREGLWGFPARVSEPWTILIAPFNAAKLSKRAAVRHAWM